ncbi:hypothetical protein [Mycolicibacterium hodleri]|uniref:Uncharacterized protein n=1 Tax=Mycolicibacterium hodleri TaxID=49897 RepID=A0A502ECV2_9MYCO|nr:hypothetical protein [Mycolicibacterium hodleri]TPG34290.1 hypothetical protein EAH80_11955 [Mycolicibacterium hodleri]
MADSRGRRGLHSDETARAQASNGPHLQRLTEAQATLEEARRNAKWRRKCKNLQAAAHAVQVAALAAHDAGIGWTEIGDVLGIQRAVPPASTPEIQAQPSPAVTTPLHSVPDESESVAS